MSTVEFWNVETLKAFSEEVKDVPVCGKLVRIKKLSSKVMLGDSNTDDTVGVMLEAVVEPKLTKEMLSLMPAEFTKELFGAITEFSGLSMEKAEKN